MEAQICRVVQNILPSSHFQTAAIDLQPMEEPPLKPIKAILESIRERMDGGETRYIGVLELPPVDSPQTAVRAAIVSKAQK